MRALGILLLAAAALLQGCAPAIMVGGWFSGAFHVPGNCGVTRTRFDIRHGLPLLIAWKDHVRSPSHGQSGNVTVGVAAPVPFVLPTVVVGYGFVIPRSCIAGVNELTIGFGTTILGAVLTYVAGQRAVLPKGVCTKPPLRMRIARAINRQAASPSGWFGRLLGLIWPREHGRLNAEVSAWMRGERAELPRPMQGDDAPVWTRLYGERNPEPTACDTLGRVLSALRVKRLVVGHTVQQSGINAACNERVYRIDIGLSRYYGTKPAEVLEIQGDAVKVLRVKSVEPARAAAAQAVSAP